MSKRDAGDDDEGPAVKMRKSSDTDDGAGGRAGRVRKKSAKVLEMEEFEQAEKTSTTTKKGKTPKVTPVTGSDSDVSDSMPANKKPKPVVEVTPLSRKTKKKSIDSSKSVPAELTLRAPDTMMMNPMETLTHVALQQQDIKTEITPFNTPIPNVMSSSNVQPTVIKQENSESVIKNLLSGPLAGSTPTLSTGFIEAPTVTPIPSKKSSKKIKFEDGSTSTPKSKHKEKKMKIEIMSPSELKPPVSSPPPPPPPPAEPKGAGIKMKIVGGSNPMMAKISLDVQANADGQTPAKGKKAAAKKQKTPKDSSNEESKKLDITNSTNEEKSTKKKKVSKKKEKLIQDAINAAQQVPGIASPPHQPFGGSGVSPPVTQKASKKKEKNPPVKKEPVSLNDSLVMDFEVEDMEEREEATLVIAETEKKKKAGKKTKSPKEPKSKEEQKTKKVPKRAPTAYMLFCNTHRPGIVAANPGIEFAAISRKLGELWQTQSSKQKLLWRRKAQRRMNKTNLISTGKNGKESQGGSGANFITSSHSNAKSTNQKLALMLQKSRPVVADEGPLSPTKVGIDSGLEHDSDSYTFSIEPLDVAAHLKLLGESLSIIGMRLQEHKGMIAVQGSLSVLLDSLLCACGPLLCLTQQVPGMDGCSPSVHAQTLDSVAYVMPGL